MGDHKRLLRSRKLRTLLLIRYDYTCPICKSPLTEDWEADHVKPWVETKRTNLFEMQPLCKTCNRKKGAS